jgi:hypothetical protein
MATAGSAWVRGISTGIRIGRLQGGTTLEDGGDVDTLARGVVCDSAAISVHPPSNRDTQLPKATLIDISIAYPSRMSGVHHHIV